MPKVDYEKATALGKTEEASSPETKLLITPPESMHVPAPTPGATSPSPECSIQNCDWNSLVNIGRSYI